MKSFFKITVVSLSIFLTSCYSTRTTTQSSQASKSVNWEMYRGTEQNLREYFNSSSEKLDPIEGVFTISHKIYNSYGSLIEQEDNWATLAIV